MDDKGETVVRRPPPSIYRTPWSRRILNAHYDTLLAGLTFPVESKTVNTTWGLAHVLIAGPSDAPPLILWQGTAAPAPAMLDLFSPFVGPYRVYAPDWPCQAGSRSAPARLDPDGEIGRWAAAVVRGLGLAPTPERPLLHAGISFGGGIIIDLARVDPALISAAALLVPSSLHPDYDSLWSQLRLTRRVFLPMVAYRWIPWFPGTKHRVFASMFDEPDAEHPLMKQQALAFKHVLWYPIPAKKAIKGDFVGYTAPTLVVAATRDVYGAGEATAAAAAEIFANVETEVVDANHVPGKEKMDAILARVAGFFEAKGFRGSASGPEMGDKVKTVVRRPPPSIYRTPWSRRVLNAHYDALMASLPFPVESKTVNTTWGLAHVLIAGPADATPLILWQGTAAVAPVMLDLFSPFVGPYRVYAPDWPCQAGSRSTPALLDPDGEMGRWAAAVVRGLGLAPTADRPLLHAGISFGGGIIIDLARADPALISAAVLLVPCSLHPDCDSLWSQLTLARRVFLPVALYGWIPWFPGSKHRSFAGMFDQPDAEHPAMTQQSLAFKHVWYFPPPAKKATKEDLERYTAPTLVVATTNDVFGDGAATLAAAEQVFADVETMLVEGKHVPEKDKMDAILARVARFFEAKGFRGGVGV